MKVPKISWAIAGMSAFWIVIATIRWFFIYPDFSTCLLANMIGVGGLLVAYIYWYMRSMDDRMDMLHKRVDKIWEEKGIIV